MPTMFLISCVNMVHTLPVWPDWAIYRCLSNFLKHVTTIFSSNCPLLYQFLRHTIKIFHFSSPTCTGDCLGSFLYRPWATFLLYSTGHPAYLYQVSVMDTTHPRRVLDPKQSQHLKAEAVIDAVRAVTSNRSYICKYGILYYLHR